MPIIHTQQLAKTFVAVEKQPGLRGSIRSLFRPVHRETHAVKGITFTVEEGHCTPTLASPPAGTISTETTVTLKWTPTCAIAWLGVWDHTAGEVAAFEWVDGTTYTLTGTPGHFYEWWVYGSDDWESWDASEGWWFWIE